jgi:hypothetical protein
MDRFQNPGYQDADTTAIFGFPLQANARKTLESIEIEITDNSAGSFVFFGAVATTLPVQIKTWDVEDLSAGESGLITVTGTLNDPLASGPLANVAEIATASPEDDTSDNRARASILVLAANADSTVVTPEEGGTLVYTDPQGLTTTIEVPPGAVTTSLPLVYTPFDTPTQEPPTGFQFANHFFDLTAYVTGIPSGYVFKTPIYVTIHYSDADVFGLDETTLTLHYWSGGAGPDAACGAGYERHPDENWLKVPICHLTPFALLGQVSQADQPVGGYTQPLVVPLELGAAGVLLVTLISAGVVAALAGRRRRSD